ncbi:MAG: serine/threonine protein kinase [Acidobacteriota bacterium]|nr:serine/threonine protein kinase [Acidobacteriota bacterium]
MNAGDQYGPYRIVSLIGRGAMGEVYLADNTQTGRQIALKVVYHGPDPEDVEVLEAERLGAELQKRLAGVDPRVVVVNQYGNIGRDLFIEMEYIEGEDLSTVLVRGPLDPQRAARIAIALSEMLEHLRAFTTTIDDKKFIGLVHGDLKPRNIRITPKEEVKVLDFGIAKALSHTRKHTINLFASKAYCSPERLETQNMDTHSDLWSVGVLLYQMISGRLPFDEPSVERLERRIRSDQLPNPLPATCPESLRNIVFRMLARDPNRRYQNATDVKQDLARFLLGEKIQAPSYESEATVRTAAPSSRPVLPVARRAASPAMRRTGGCLAVFGVVALLVFAATAMQVSFYDDAHKLKSDIETNHIDADEAWTRYHALNRRRHLPLLAWGLGKALKSRLIAAGNAPILEYRNSDAPTVRENQWKQAFADLSRAQELDPEDSKIRGAMAICQGHLDRINAKGPNRGKMLNAATAKFHEAAELLKKSPDPYLGLARLYVYDLNDMDRAEEALNKAWDYGHPKGKRERAQLADGYFRRAERTVADSRSFSEMPQQQTEYLDRARRDYLRAEDLYSQVGPFFNATQNRIKAIRAVEHMEDRIRELQ